MSLQPAPDPDPTTPDEWLSFDHDGETYTFDVTFLTSSWSCIYGAGCPGIGPEPAPELELGCCTWGAHFTDKADRKRVQKRAKELEPDEWQLQGRRRRARRTDRQERRRRLGHPGRRRRLHLPEPPRSSAGRRLRLPPGRHRVGARATSTGSPRCAGSCRCASTTTATTTTTSPTSCASGSGATGARAAPTSTGGAPRTTRRSCGHDPVYRSCADEIIALVGDAPYRRLVELLDRRGREVLLPHPALNRKARTADR